MTATIIYILIIITCVVLAFFVLIQNPKGGGLAGSFGGVGTQVMGAKQSSDVVEKGTWYTVLVLGALILMHFAISPKSIGGKTEKTRSEKLNMGSQMPVAPATNTPPPATTTAPANSTTPPTNSSTPPATNNNVTPVPATTTPPPAK